VHVGESDCAAYDSDACAVRARRMWSIRRLRLLHGPLAGPRLWLVRGHAAMHVCQRDDLQCDVILLPRKYHLPSDRPAADTDTVAEIRCECDVLLLVVGHELPSLCQRESRAQMRMVPRRERVSHG
jgi:hypothetical protein